MGKQFDQFNIDERYELDTRINLSDFAVL